MKTTPITNSSAWAVPTAVALVLYLAVAFLWSWPLATQPGAAITELTSTNPHEDTIGHYDRLLTIAGTARNSAALINGEPGKLFGTGLCYPHPFAGTLGEHMIELGIVAMPFRIFTDNPIALHNATLLVSFLISGLAMFAAVFYWTGSGPAAVLSGLALAIHPERLMNLAHPAVVAVYWVPLVLLFFDRLVEKGRVRDALLLTLTSCLQAVTGSYPLLTFLLVALPYGTVRMVQQRRHLDLYKLGLLGIAVAATLAVTAAVSCLTSDKKRSGRSPNSALLFSLPTADCCSVARQRSE